MFGAAVEKALEHREEFRLVEQEGVMPLVRFDLDEADIGGDRIERVDDHAALIAGRQDLDE